MAGVWLHRRYPDITDEHKDDLSVILAATMTLLALIIGFSFSMATERYDQRKNFEEAEANAIGTELLRVDFLPPDDAARVRKLLGDYLDQRIMFYINKDDAERARIDQRTSRLQGELWAAVRDPVAAQQTPVTALALAGMNDVLNSQGYTQAAYWNRICAVLLGYRARHPRRLALVLPLVVSISLLLIADIDAPRHGLIHISPQNLQSLAQSMGRSSP
jgi:hypothetical protein